MKNIVLMCSQGASTSILVQKMLKVAEKRGLECTIKAYSVNEVEAIKDVADVILMGPQVKYMVDQVQSRVACKVAPIEMRMYGMADGEGVLDFALSLIDA